MPNDNGNNVSIIARCRQLFSSGHTIIVTVTSVGLLGVLGTLIGVWTSLNSTIAEIRKDAQDIQHQLDTYERADQVWKDEEHRYDREVRDTMRADQQNMNDALRQMNNRINDVALRVGVGGNGQIPNR